MNFIELTISYQSQKVLINLNNITSIHPTTKGTQICRGTNEEDFFIIEESYEYVKDIIFRIKGNK